ncbi:hypothetical protein [Chryseobacterium luquanense]|uniref:Lipoprotein n=1 Tax=Chryseobacterium luquanense TaxID=2983766 RepID=A0ABT3Y2D5_9FLAO|nr:hypothetical protein [Chryseobacterium luquanense]MCX8532298.1 hypothetical protein [Chryseobacterium luquanense]
MMKLLHFPLLFLSLLFLACSNETQSKTLTSKNKSAEKKNISFNSDTKTIHIFVALCDNKYQGIVPVPEKIGNGQDPDNNLYWGCAFGVRSYFKKSKEWKLIESRKLKSEKLERIIFKHVTKNFYLVADAYDGKFIKESTIDFLNSSSGKSKDTLKIGKTTIGIGGNSKLLAYIGHDGLMDFQLNETFENTDKEKRDVIILACYSKKYFAPHLAKSNVNPLVWTTGLMSPEAYTLHDAISGYVLNENNEQIRTRAAKAYSKYQKCSEKAARNLLVTN